MKIDLYYGKDNKFHKEFYFEEKIHLDILIKMIEFFKNKDIKGMEILFRKYVGKIEEIELPDYVGLYFDHENDFDWFLDNFKFGIWNFIDERIWEDVPLNFYTINSEEE